MRSGGGGPARARNIGWRHARRRGSASSTTTWCRPGLVRGPARRPDRGRAGRRRQPGPACGCRCPSDRRPTDWERSTAGLRGRTWITADISYRRAALAAVGGFDERFPRAFREDADLGLRVTAAPAGSYVGPPPGAAPGAARGRLGERAPAGRQRRRLPDASGCTGRDWRARAAARHGPPRRHAAHRGGRRPRGLRWCPGHRRVAGAAGLAWAAAGTAEFAWARIAPGPATAPRSDGCSLTSAAIPVAATWHSPCGVGCATGAPRPGAGLPDLVLFDRDGTLVHDVPYNGDPALVDPVADGAAQSLDRLRGPASASAWSATSPASARGRITAEQVDGGQRRRRRPARSASTSGASLPARPRRRLHLPQARAAAGHGRLRASSVSTRIGACSSATSAATSRPPRRPARRGVLVPTAATRPEEVAAAAPGSWRRPAARASTTCWEAAGDALPRGPARQRRGRAARRPGRARRRRGQPTGDAPRRTERGRRPPRLLPGVDEVLAVALPVDRRRAGARRPGRRRPSSSTTLAGPRVRPRAGPHLLPPVAAAHGPAAAAGRRAVDRRGQRGLPRQRCSTCGTGRPTGLPRGRARACRWPPRPAIALPAGDDGRLAVRRPLPDRSRLVRRALRRAAPGHLRAGPGLARRARWRELAAAARAPRAAGSWSPAAAARRALTAAVAAAYGHGDASTSAAAPRSPSSRRCSPPPPPWWSANTGPAHLAAAVGTPVVSLFAPTVPCGALAPTGRPRRAARRPGRAPAAAPASPSAPSRATRA